MNDLISRQAAIDAMRELPYGYRGIVWDILNSLPSVQPEQKHGRNLMRNFLNLFECSVCDYRCDDPEYASEIKYCPNCGARMDGEVIK